jgi:hypothetical protein
MRKTIDTCTSLTGWTSGSGSTISAYSLNANQNYIADNQASSIIFKIPIGNLNKYISKTITVDVTGYEEIVLWTWSRNKYAESFTKPIDYSYSIDFGGTAYYLPVKSQMNMVVLSCAGMTELTRIRITALHDDDDYLLISSIAAVVEQNPIDCYKGLQTGLLSDITLKYPNGLKLGTSSPIAGDKTITIFGLRDYLERFSVIKIKDFVNSEIHQIDKNDETNFGFNSLYSGRTILNTYTDADIYLQFPVNYTQDTSEIELPSITIFGITPELIRRGSALEDIFDTHTVDDGDIQVRREGAIFKYHFLLDCEARHEYTLSIISEITRKFLAKETLWINNKKYRMVWEGSPTELMPNEAFDIIPKIQYTLSLEMIEGLYVRQSLTKVIDDNLTVNVN